MSAFNPFFPLGYEPVSTALDAYEVDTGSYPKGKNGLNALIVAPSDAQNWKGP